MSPQTKRCRWWLAESGGYSLIELLTAVAIFGVLAAIGLPHVDLRRQDLNSAVAQVTSDLRFSRAHSITTGQHYALVVDEDGTYKIDRLTQNAGGEWEPDFTAKAVTLPPMITLALPDDVDQIEFNTRGMVISPAEPFEIEITDTANDITRVLSIWPSGQVHDGR